MSVNRRSGPYSPRLGTRFVGGFVLGLALTLVYSEPCSARSWIEKGVGWVTEGAIGYWDFNEGSGEIANDLAPYANDGILINDPTWILGNTANGAIRFDGVDDYVYCGNGPGIATLNEDFSVTFRMRTTARGRTEYLIYKGGLSVGFYFRTHVDNTILFKLDDGTNDVYRASDTTAPTDGNWHYIAARVSGRSFMELYVDGVLQTNGSPGLSNVGNITNLNDLTFGGTPVSPASYYQGDLDDVRIYERVLAVTEILAIQNEWTPPEEVTPTPVPPTPTATPTPTNGGGEPPPTTHLAYVRPPGGSYGREDGSDWANAFEGLPTNLLRGWTYYLADGNYPGRNLSTPVAGSQPVRIFKATVDEHGTNIGWNPSFGDGAATFTDQLTIWTANWTIDGRRRNSDWKSGYGIRIDASGNKGIRIIRDGVNNVTIRNIEIEGRGDDGSASPANDMVYITAEMTGFVLSRCYLHDSGRTFILLRGADDGLVEYCYFARNESVPTQHAEGISAFNGTDRWTIRHNVWEDTEGTGIIMFAGDEWKIYGNTCFRSGTRPVQIGNGTFATWGGLTVTRALVIHNTFAWISGQAGFNYNSTTGSTGNLAFNNLWYQCEKVRFNGVLHDYNWFFESENQTEPNRQMGTGDPFVDSANFNFNLAVPTAPGLGPLEVPFHVDPMGRIRGADGVWDRGAYELGDEFVGGPGAGLYSNVEAWGLYK